MYNKLRKNKRFYKELEFYRKNYIGRPSPLTFAERLSAAESGSNGKI
ncbi:tryptophan synthase subunit beta domain protein [Leptospira santarosai str. HAI134]|nr:tryptophan synthase subunit beta domain protein [Leptospira santarosai str. HAI134]